MEERLLYLASPRMTGEDIYNIEIQLEALGYDCKMSSAEKTSKQGIFGPACDAAVRAFQKDHAVDIYGKVGPFTRAALVDAQKPAMLADQFVAWLKTQIGNIYVWGGQGENLTTMTDEDGKPLKVKTPDAWIRSMEDTTSNANRAIAFYQMRLVAGQNPILAYDCSGLIVLWLLKNGLISGDLTSRGLYRICTPITRAKLEPGDLLFRDNGAKIHHVGVYVGDNKVIEAMGRDQGVVMRDINASGAGYWTDYGALPFMN